VHLLEAERLFGVGGHVDSDVDPEELDAVRISVSLSHTKPIKRGEKRIEICAKLHSEGRPAANSLGAVV
jgi:hypothetical protein